MDDKSDATNESVAINNASVANNKSPATTGCGSGSNEIGATNLYKYSPYYNKSYVTCCCCVSIETGTYVAAIVLCVIYMISAILEFLGVYVTENIWWGAFGIVLFFACLLVIFAQYARNQWLFLPCLILGLIELILIGYSIKVYLECSRDTLAELKKSSLLRPEHGNECTSMVIGSVLLILLDVWLYSVILRGLLAIREVDRRRSSPHF
uniref:MARVEL domain-containing protein n=1 Tax=Globodera rostochiensis TaxID=31243 RepID=A0A914I143_GLORO